MAGRKEIAITDRQYAALEILWQRDPLTVRQLREHPRLSLRLRLLPILVCFGIGTAVGNVTLPAAADEPAAALTPQAAIGSKPDAESSSAATAADAPQQKPAKRTLKKRPPDKNSLGGRIYETEIMPISIKGRAKDDKGQPLGGSEIFLAVANGFSSSGSEHVLARTTTDAAGQYAFDGVSLPVRIYPPKPEVAEGRFQVFGIAKGHGFAWHGVRSYRPRPRPAAESEPGMDRAYYEGEAIQNDLVFGLVVNLTGRILDDLGRPVVGAKVRVGVFNDPRRNGPGATMYRFSLLAPDDVPADTDRTFYSVTSLPESRLSAKTDAEGRYRIDEISRDAIFAAAVFAQEFDPLTTTIVTSDRKDSGSVNAGQGVWNPVLVAPRTVTVRALDPDTKAPLGDVAVRAYARKARYVGNAARTDAQGRATLRLPPGHYRIVAEPAVDSHRLRTEQDLDVAEAPIEQSAELPVGRGAVVVLIATADDSTPVSGVGFRYETDVSRESVELQSQTVFVDHPTTNQDGGLRAVFAPGKRRIFVGKIPEGYELAGQQDELRDFSAGSTTTLRFELRNQPVPPVAVADDASELETRLHEQWRRQDAFKFTGRVTYRVNFSGYGDYSIQRDEIRQVVNSFAWTKGADIVARINDEFPGLDVRLAGPCRMLIDGVKHRQTLSRSQIKGSEQTDVEAFNGSEIVRYNSANNQADVTDYRVSRVHIDGVGDLRSWPFFRLGEAPDDAPSRADGRITIDTESDGHRTRLVMDESTGFVYQSFFYQKAGGSGRDLWQFGPLELPSGMIWPSLRVELQYQRDELSTINIHAIDSIEPRAMLPADAFAVSVPAGALVSYLDGSESNRGPAAPSAPMQGMTTGPVTDVVQFAYSLSPRSRSLWPVVKFGEPAPGLNAAAWLTHEGKIEPPDLKGKVVLIDFWGQGCGPCVAELPKLVDLAKQYAASDLRIVGWHDSSGDIENVGRFARTHGLQYTLAIDRPAEETGWFGAAFKSFGVRAIPHAALIDRHGRLVILGRLDEVIGRLDNILGASPASPAKTNHP
jgi:thiol-disulfide isomerase/thioredoxin/protocatechuate 3,4-dioxygenase beta subunit